MNCNRYHGSRTRSGVPHGSLRCGSMAGGMFFEEVQLFSEKENPCRRTGKPENLFQVEIRV